MPPRETIPVLEKEPNSPDVSLAIDRAIHEKPPLSLAKKALEAAGLFSKPSIPGHDLGPALEIIRRDKRRESRP